MLHQKLSIIGVTFAALLLAACNPIPANLVPTPTPMPAEREPLQMSLYDFANYLARLDQNALEPALYAEAVLEIVACMEKEVVYTPPEVENYTPGEKAAENWWIIGVFMALVAEQEFKHMDENTNFGMHSWLKAAHTLCTELD